MAATAFHSEPILTIPLCQLWVCVDPRSGTLRMAERYWTRHGKHVELEMDWNRIEGNWKQTKGKIKEKWGQLTDDDLGQIDGKREQLEGKLQQRYGLAKDLARKDVDDWLKAQ
jgi:uncharacterized protein YjbJ (UPF0337 family)